MPIDMSARRPAALSRGPATKPRSNAVARRGSRPGDGEQRAHARMRAAAADAREALLDEDAVGLVEPHDVGDGAERDEVEQRAEIRLARAPRRRRRARSRARSRQQHVEHHADAGDVLATETRSRAGWD